MVNAMAHFTDDEWAEVRRAVEEARRAADEAKAALMQACAAHKEASHLLSEAIFARDAMIKEDDRRSSDLPPLCGVGRPRCAQIRNSTPRKC